MSIIMITKLFSSIATKQRGTHYDLDLVYFGEEIKACVPRYMTIEAR